MIIRQRATVLQLYRSVYDPVSKRSRTLYVGAFPKYAEPTTELLATLAESERVQLGDYLAARKVAQEAIHGRYEFADTPAALRRVAAWLRGEQKTTEIQRGAKAIREAYADLYAVMRTMGIARLRAGTARRAKGRGDALPPASETADGAGEASPAPGQDSAALGEAPIDAVQPGTEAPTGRG